MVYCGLVMQIVPLFHLATAENPYVDDAPARRTLVVLRDNYGAAIYDAIAARRRRPTSAVRPIVLNMR